jgi:Thioredoxin-like domain
VDPRGAYRGVKLAFPALALAACTAAFAVTVGETYNQVIAEKGRPVDITYGGSMVVLSYPDMVIKVKDGAVVAIKAPNGPPPAQRALPAPAHAGAVAAGAPARPPQSAVAQAQPGPATPAEYRGPAVWEYDIGVAMHQAQIEKRHVLVLFTGSDWCEWCQKMEDEVFSQREFAVYTHERWILVKLDYPHALAQTDALKNQNAEMLRRFDVKEFPNAVIMDDNSRLLTRIPGYREGGAGNFIKLMKPYE